MSRILFISRAFPPIVGGLENQNRDLSIWLPKLIATRTIANRRGKRFLPLFLPYACLKALTSMREYDALLLGDAVLAIVGFVVKLLCRKPVLCVTHGLDLTYPLPVYQRLWLGLFLKKLDRIIAVGNETIEAGVRRGLPREKFVFIPNGIDAEQFCVPHTREELERVLGEKLGGRKVVLSTGRLAVHKGVDWFIAEVVPRLPANVVFVVAGDGVKRQEIESLIRDKGLSGKVRMLGQVSDEVREILYNTADIYVKPNVPVPGTMEGFGLVALEAAAARLPVIASDLEGLKDAVKDGANGFLVAPRDTDAWLELIETLLSDDRARREFGEQARRHVIANYSWTVISARYVEVIENAIREAGAKRSGSGLTSGASQDG